MRSADLARRQTAALAAIQRVLGDVVAELWKAVVVDLSDASLEAWLLEIRPLVLGAQNQASALTLAYLGELGLDLVAPRDLEAVRDVDPSVAWSRPVVTARAKIAEGKDGSVAFRQGLRRAKDLSATAVQLAQTHTAREVMLADRRVVGYRRVLNGARSCGLCAVASTQRYRVGDLMPIHSSCDCGVAPIIGSDDPGQVINEGLLDGLNSEVRARFGPNVERSDWANLLVTEAHGEVGPVLTVRKHSTQGPPG